MVQQTLELDIGNIVEAEGLFDTQPRATPSSLVEIAALDYISSDAI